MRAPLVFAHDFSCFLSSQLAPADIELLIFTDTLTHVGLDSWSGPGHPQLASFGSWPPRPTNSPDPGPMDPPTPAGGPPSPSLKSGPDFSRPVLDCPGQEDPRALIRAWLPRNWATGARMLSDGAWLPQTGLWGPNQEGLGSASWGAGWLCLARGFLTWPGRMVRIPARAWFNPGWEGGSSGGNILPVWKNTAYIASLADICSLVPSVQSLSTPWQGPNPTLPKFVVLIDLSVITHYLRLSVQIQSYY